MNIYIGRDSFYFCGKVSELQEFWRQLAPLMQSGVSVKEFCRLQLN